MEQEKAAAGGDRPVAAGDRAEVAEGVDPAFAGLVAAIDRLDDLGLADEWGRPVVEPSSTFHCS